MTNDAAKAPCALVQPHVRRILVAFAALALLAVAGTLGPARVSAHGSAAGSRTSFADIARRCAAKTDGSGFGSVTIQKTVVSKHETVRLGVPCTIHLTHGATLDIEGSTLKTAKLIVADDDDAHVSSSVRIAGGTTMTGTASAGLLIQLRHAGDTIFVDHATITYPLSVFLETLNSDGSGTPGNITVTSTTITSSSSASEGIHLMAEGAGTFRRDTFRTPADDGSAVMYAATCTRSHVTGGVPKCSP